MNPDKQKNAPRLICLSGPDGVGKTTQAHRLVRALRSDGRKAVYRWLRFSHVLATPILALMRFRGLTIVRESSNGTAVGSHNLENSIHLSRLYKVALLLDMLVATFFKLRLRMALGTSIICDRYIVDAIVDTMVSTGDYEFHKSTIGRALLKIAPGCAQHIIITASPEVLVTRRNEIGYDERLETRVELYSKVAQDLGLAVVNAESITEEATESEIRRLVKEL